MGLGVDAMLAVFGSAHNFIKEFVTVHFGWVCFLDFLFNGDLFQRVRMVALTFLFRRRINHKKNCVTLYLFWLFQSLNPWPKVIEKAFVDHIFRF